eukprot:1874936-Amphidinium_carterae.1
MHRLMFIDITRAHPHCLMRGDQWIVLPPEDPRAGEEGVCGKLEWPLYGTRDAGQNFELLVTGVMSEIGFDNGVWSPCIFVHRERNMQAFVYGDNF